MFDMPCQTTMLQSDAGQPLASIGGVPRWDPKSLGRRADFMASANRRSYDQSSTPLRLTPIRLADGTSRASRTSQRSWAERARNGGKARRRIEAAPGSNRDGVGSGSVNGPGHKTGRPTTAEPHRGWFRAAAGSGGGRRVEGVAGEADSFAH